MVQSNWFWGVLLGIIVLIVLAFTVGKDNPVIGQEFNFNELKWVYIDSMQNKENGLNVYSISTGNLNGILGETIDGELVREGKNANFLVIYDFDVDFGPRTPITDAKCNVPTTIELDGFGKRNILQYSNVQWGDQDLRNGYLVLNCKVDGFSINPLIIHPDAQAIKAYM